MGMMSAEDLKARVATARALGAKGLVQFGNGPDFAYIRSPEEEDALKEALARCSAKPT